MANSSTLPIPFISAWDPRATASGSIDPLGALRAYTAIATTLLPGVTTITTRTRYLSWVCAGLRLLDETRQPIQGGRAGRNRRRQVLPWERLLALASTRSAVDRGAKEEDPAWQQLRGISYVRRALEEGVSSPKFTMLRNQAGIGGVGTYWVTLVSGDLAEYDSARLTERGEHLADAFLNTWKNPPRSALLTVLTGQPLELPKDVLSSWGTVVHLGAASSAEKRLLADALLEPPAHRVMAVGMQVAGVKGSSEKAFKALETALLDQSDPLATRLAAVLEATRAFEALHSSLLHMFNQLLAVDTRGLPIKLSTVALPVDEQLRDRAARLSQCLKDRSADLPRGVAESLSSFHSAVSPITSAESSVQMVRSLLRYHERVQSGKLDASRQPKRPWIDLLQDSMVVSPRYALPSTPEPPKPGAFTFAYRLSQFAGMLNEAGAWKEKT